LSTKRRSQLLRNVRSSSKTCITSSTFSLAVKYDLDIDHTDAVSAFLQEKLSEKIYVTQPEGFEIKNKEYYVYRLNKAIYGFKQSGKAWNNKLRII